MDIPAAQAAALVHRPVVVETQDGPEAQLQPVFAHEVFAVALTGHQITVVTIDGRKLLGSLPDEQTADATNTPAALPDAPHPELQPAGEEISPAAPEAAGDNQNTHPADGGDVSAEPGATSVAPAPAPTPAAAADEATKPTPSRGKPATRSKSGGKNGGAK